MRTLSSRLTILLAVIILSATACATGSRQGPQTESSASSLSYASGYNARLMEVSERYTFSAAEAETNIGEFASFPDALDADKTEWARVVEIYEAADEAGRSAAVAETIRTSQKIARFHKEREDAFARRIAGSVAASLKKESCPCGDKAGGAARYGLGQAVKAELEDYQRQYNEAHELIEVYEEEVGKRNVKKLEEQADRLTATSYIVHVELVESRATIERLIDESRKVTGTLDKAIAKERETLEDPKAKKADKRRAEKRIKRLDESRAPIAATVEAAEKQLKATEKDIKRIQDAHEDAIDKLVDATEFKAVNAK